MLPGQRFIEDRIVGAVRAWMIVGILLKVTRVRDRFDLPAIVYYSTPWPVLAAGFVLLALHFWRRAAWHPMRRYLAFAVVALFTWIATSWYSAAPGAGPTDLRVVLWNVARPLERLPGCVKWLRAQDADVICLAEVSPESGSTLALWQADFPEYQLMPGKANMLCLVRGEAIDSKYINLGNSSHSMLHRLRARGREVTLLQVDLIALPRSSRGPQLRKLAEIANAHPNGQLIIAGDFNTPRESAHFDALRGKFRHAFETAGRGLAETWPSFAPALSLDQIWLGSGWQPLSCHHGSSWRSDHRPVVVDLATTAR